MSEGQTDAGRDDDAEGSAPDGNQVMIVGPDGQPVGTVRVPAAGDAPSGGPRAGDATETASADAQQLAGAVEEPAKVMRIGTMIKQLLEEVRASDLDDPSRRRLAEIHAASLRELEAALSAELRSELARMIEPFDSATTPSDGELRIAQAQLVGWLEGLFHGIQTALVAQQLAAKMQLDSMRRGLPAGAASGAAGGLDATGGATTGQYL